MQACYVNTTHPDFLNGHKVRLQCLWGVQARSNDSNDQAMGIVTERLNANKPQPPATGGKLAPGQINNNKDLDVEAKKEEPGFFGSFWNQKTAGKGKKVGAASMEAVSGTGITCCRSLTRLTATLSHHRLSSHNLL